MTRTGCVTQRLDFANQFIGRRRGKENCACASVSNLALHRGGYVATGSAAGVCRPVDDDRKPSEGATSETWLSSFARPNQAWSDDVGFPNISRNPMESQQPLSPCRNAIVKR